MYLQRYVLANSGHSVTYPQQGDFLIDDRFLFEVGGKTKTSVKSQTSPILSSLQMIWYTDWAIKSRCIFSCFCVGGLIEKIGLPLEFR